MTWCTQIGRLPDSECDPRHCQGTDCQLASAPYLARTEWLSLGIEPPAESPRFKRLCVNCAAKFAAAMKPRLPFPPGYWKAGKLGKPPLVFDLSKGEPGTCSSCKQPIVWVRTDAGKSMPCNPEDATSHFITCPNRDQHRKPR